MKFYVYCLIDPRTDQPFYVGKGYNRRMYGHETETRCRYWNNKEKCKIIQSIWNNGLQIKYKQTFVNTHEEACKKEKELIALYGRRKFGGLLTNVHVGGNGNGRNGKPVCQYTKVGKFVAEYQSASEAERKTQTTLSQITAVCRGDWKIANGFQWKWKGDSPIQNYQRVAYHRKTVYQYDIQGNFIAMYRSEYDAAKAIGCELISGTKISACCTGKLQSYKGFMWKFFQKNKINSIKLRKQKVLQLTKQTKAVIMEFDSIQAAENATKVVRSAISACCRGLGKTAGGYIWEYKE